MRQVKVILEAGNDGYGVSFPAIENVYGFGDTIDSAKQDAQDVLDFYIETLNKVGKPVPAILQEEYELLFEFDVEALLKYIDGVVTKTAIAKVSGINAAQLSQYSSGSKKPRKAQRDKIISALHQIGNDLIAVS